MEATQRMLISDKSFCLTPPQYLTFVIFAALTFYSSVSSALYGNLFGSFGQVLFIKDKRQLRVQLTVRLSLYVHLRTFCNSVLVLCVLGTLIQSERLKIEPLE